MIRPSSTPPAAARRLLGGAPALAGAALLVAACGRAPAPVEVEAASQVMGTFLDVRAWAADSSSAGSAAEAARRAVARVDSLMSTYRDDSEVSALARAAGTGRWTRLSPETLEVLTTALGWARRSGGAFDPTVGPLMTAWGFHGGEPSRPDSAALARAREAVGWQGVEVDTAGRRARLVRPGARLDFGAIAKGYALDRALAAMEAKGASAGYVDLGGNVSVFGPPPRGGDAWVLGVRHPRRPDELMATIRLARGSVATSGDYEQMFVEDGVRYAHIMDPRTGEPARGVVAVTVAAPDGVTADALSTLLYVLGPEEGRAFLDRELPGRGVSALWVRDTGGREVTAADVTVAPGAADVELALPDSAPQSARPRGSAPGPRVPGLDPLAAARLPTPPACAASSRRRGGAPAGAWCRSPRTRWSPPPRARRSSMGSRT